MFWYWLNSINGANFYQIKYNNQIHHNNHYFLQPFELTSSDGKPLTRKYQAKDDRLSNNYVIQIFKLQKKSDFKIISFDYTFLQSYSPSCNDTHNNLLYIFLSFLFILFSAVLLFCCDIQYVRIITQNHAMTESPNK